MPPATKRDQARKAARFTGHYRTELGFFASVFFLFWATSSLPLLTWILPLLAVVGLVIWQREKVAPHAKQMQSSAKIRRQLVTAAFKCGFDGLQAKKVVHTLPGELVDVKIPAGSTVDDLEKRAKAMAGILKATDLHVLPGEHRGVASVSIIRRDPFKEMGDLKWPLLNAERTNIRDGIPFLVNQYGGETKARLLSRNLMLGGSPDAGKSVALRPLIAGSVLDPMVKVWMMDAKPNAVEFNVWAPAAHWMVRGRDLESAVEMFAVLSERVEKRYYEISARNLDFVPDDMEIDVLFIDEIPQFTRGFEDDTKAQQSAVKTIRGGVWKLIALGRAAGMITIISAQKPTVDIVPSESRDLIDHKFALHCNTKAQSDAILGQGAGEESAANAADIPSGMPGVGYYVGDNGVIKGRTYKITRDECADIASRASSRRIDDEFAQLTA